MSPFLMMWLKPSQSEYFFHTLTWKILTTSISYKASCGLCPGGQCWDFGRGGSAGLPLGKETRGCPMLYLAWVALRDPSQGKTEPIRQVCCAPGKTHLRIGKIWGKEEEGRQREEGNSERKTESDRYNRGSRKIRCSMAEWMYLKDGSP